MTGTKCPSCGAASQGLVCDYCGAALGSLEDLEQQKRALEEYHKMLRTQDREARIRFLKSGFLPDYSKLLIDAGLICVSLMNENEVALALSDAASKRLEALTMKLKLLPHDHGTTQAIEMFTEKNRLYADAGKKNMLLGFAILGGALLAGALALWYFFMR